MNSNTQYWVWLSMALGAATRVDEILSCFSSPREIYESDRTGRILSGVFSKAQLDRLERTPLKNAQAAIETCSRNGWKIYTLADREYPEGLRRLADRPLVLYVDGDISYLNSSVCIGVVGTRKPSYESIAVARKLSADMAAMKAVVISGGALGIDSAAHEGALESGGKTLCIMGCGLGCGYLKDNEALRRKISASGALVTEYPPFKDVTRASFPERNRIISGIGMGVLGIEAGERSGSLITARRAVEQGRDVFAIPGSVLSTAYTGVNRLIRDGAKAVTCAEDVLSAYEMMYPERLDLTAKAPDVISVKLKEEAFPAKAKPEKPAVPKTGKEPSAGLDPDSLAVYKLFGSEPLHADDICAESGMPMAKVLSALMILEMENLVEATEGRCYQLVY